MKNVIVILGPTASGKSGIAIECAKKINGEIISADSMQIYKGLDIGTAKIQEQEKQGVKHHLIDIKNFNESYNVWNFTNDCKKIIDKIIQNGKTPIIVGGTNLYISALIKDYNFEKSNKCEQKYELKNEVNYKVFAINLPRDILYENINNRVDIMLKNGFLEEVKNLKNNGLTLEMQSGQSIGYKEILTFLCEGGDWNQTVDKIKQHSRNYAKRQLTWLRGMEKLIWIDGLNKKSALETIIKNL